jgi:hypothetical protein
MQKYNKNRKKRIKCDENVFQSSQKSNKSAKNCNFDQKN